MLCGQGIKEETLVSEAHALRVIAAGDVHRKVCLGARVWHLNTILVTGACTAILIVSTMLGNWVGGP